MPPQCLANDMWIGYGPPLLSERKVTIMEMICASPCITTLTCMTMEARYDADKKENKPAAPLDSTAHLARHRFGGRGNALTFPLPMEELLLALKTHIEDVGEGLPLLPHSGELLGNVARVLLKTNKQGATSEEEIKSLIHQAVVRRDVAQLH